MARHRRNMRWQAMTARKAHRLVAAGLALFLGAHMGNHLVGTISGPEAHEALRQVLARAYRHPVVEPLLVLALVAQLGLGLWLARARHWRGMQALSGLVLAAFLPVHLGAILAARAAGVTTGLGFAAAGVQDWPWALFFLPYYGLAAWALMAHGAHGVARFWPPSAKAIRRGGHLAGLGAALAILALLSGALHLLQAPPFHLIPG